MSQECMKSNQIKIKSHQNKHLFKRFNKIYQQNREREKVDISWFLSTFSELAVNLMCQLTIEISWLSQLLANY